MQTEALGSRIRELREQKGITQSQLADRMVVSRSTVANWEAGKRLPEAEVCGFPSSAEALDFARASHVSVAFLDIELSGDDGIALARELTRLDPCTNIIFLTSHTEYMHAALTDHCSGYVLKPLTPEKIRHEITHLRFPVRGLKL